MEGGGEGGGWFGDEDEEFVATRILCNWLICGDGSRWTPSNLTTVLFIITGNEKLGKLY